MLFYVLEKLRKTEILKKSSQIVTKVLKFPVSLFSVFEMPKKVPKLSKNLQKLQAKFLDFKISPKCPVLPIFVLEKHRKTMYFLKKLQQLQEKLLSLQKSSRMTNFSNFLHGKRLGSSESFQKALNFSVLLSHVFKKLRKPLKC